MRLALTALRAEKVGCCEDRSRSLSQAQIIYGRRGPQFQATNGSQARSKRDCMLPHRARRFKGFLEESSRHRAGRWGSVVRVVGGVTATSLRLLEFGLHREPFRYLPKLGIEIPGTTLVRHGFL